MIPPWIKALTPLGRIVGLIVAAGLMLAAFLFVRSWLIGGLETEAELATNQGEAAIASGKDAVGTVAEQNRREQDRARAVDDLEEKVDEADTVDGKHAAGADWLCSNFGIC